MSRVLVKRLAVFFCKDRDDTTGRTATSRILQAARKRFRKPHSFITKQKD